MVGDIQQGIFEAGIDVDVLCGVCDRFAYGLAFVRSIADNNLEYSRGMVNIPRVKLGGIRIPSALC